jgi:NifU-like protein involved in Fe-S cluster formation
MNNPHPLIPLPRGAREVEGEAKESKMDQWVIKYYRNMLKTGFKHTGCLENPSVFLDTVGEKIRICGSTRHNYLHLYINISEGKLEEIKYLCTCDPTANVVVEILGGLVEKKTISEALSLKPEAFSQVIGGGDEDFLKKAQGILDLLKRGLDRYNAGIPANKCLS